MPTTYRGAAFASGDTVSSISLTLPATVQVDDVMVLRIAVRTAARSITTPTGWTSVGVEVAESSSTVRQAIYYRVAVSGDAGSSLTINIMGGTGRIVADVIAIEGADLTTPIAAALGQGNASSTSIIAPSITPGVADTFLVGFFAVGVGASNITAPGTMTERSDYGPGSSLRAETATEQLTASTATGTRTAVSSSAGVSVGHLVAVAPSTGAGSIAGTANLDSDADIVAIGTLVINGSSALDSDTDVAFTGSVQGSTIDGTIALDVDTDIVAIGTLVIAGDIQLDADTDVIASGGVTGGSIEGAILLDADSDIVASGTMKIAGSADFDADADIANGGRSSGDPVMGEANFGGDTEIELLSSIVGSNIVPGSPVLDIDTNIVVTGTVNSPAGSWRWTQCERVMTNRIGVVLLGSFGSAQGYLGVSDGATWRWFSGPKDTNDVLTEVVSESAAQAAAVALPVSGTGRWLLPTITTGRYIRLGHRSTSVGSNYQLTEFYPEMWIVADRIKAGTIEAKHILARTITADRIAVGALTATEIASRTITADRLVAGTITTTELNANAINGMTITGATVRTSAANPRVEMNSTSLRTYSSTGVVQIEATTSNDGKLTAGAGAVILDVNGLQIATGSGTFNTLRWMNGSTEAARLSVASGSGSEILNLRATGTSLGESTLSAQSSGNPARLKLSSASGSDPVAAFYTDGVSTFGGLGVGTLFPVYTLDVRGTARTTGNLTIDGVSGYGIAPSSAARQIIKGIGSTSSTYTLYAVNSSSSLTFNVADNGAGFLLASSWVYGSDESMKDEIEPHARGLADVLRLKPRTFRYKGQGKKSSGFVAQELEAVAPELVETMDNGLKGIKTTDLVPTVINALQELAADVQALRQEVVDLKAKDRK